MADGRVVLVEAAAWSSEGTLSFAAKGPGTMGHVDTHGGTDDITVRATTFDRTIEELNLPRVDFVKMDIEGAERYALAGGRRMIERSRPRMAICIYHAPDDRVIIPRLVLEANPGYRQFTRAGLQAYFY
jgi:FkbM family methyltransferase